MFYDKMRTWMLLSIVTMVLMIATACGGGHTDATGAADDAAGNGSGIINDGNANSGGNGSNNNGGTPNGGNNNAQFSLLAPLGGFLKTNTDEVEVFGECMKDYVVELGGDIQANEIEEPQAQLDQLCDTGEFYFKMKKSFDGLYNMYVQQLEAVNEDASDKIEFSWLRDTEAPEALDDLDIDTDFSLNDGLTVDITGACEIGADIILEGDYEAVAECDDATGTFEISLANLVQGLHQGGILQRDEAGNLSGMQLLQWLN